MICFLQKRVSEPLFLFMVMCLYQYPLLALESSPILISPSTVEKNLESGLNERTYVVCTNIINVNHIMVQTDEGQLLKIKLLGMNPPNQKSIKKWQQEIYRRGLSFCKKELKGRRVLLEFESFKQNPDGFQEAYVYYGKRLFNSEIIRKGLATVAKTDPEFQLNEFFHSKMALAQEDKIGLWTTPVQRQIQLNPPPPKPQQVQPRYQPMERYVASQRSTKFHRLSCKYGKKIDPHNLIQFNGRGQATGSGRVPCKACKP